jgi:glutamate--cysteine ligase
LAIDSRTGMTVSYDGSPGIRRFLETLRDGFGWEPEVEAGHLVALTRPDQSITLEPGGQFEMSGGAFSTLTETAAEAARHHTELQHLEEEFGVDFRFFGLNPYQTPDQLNWMPKPRYQVMRRYLPTRGDRGLYMMGMTCTVQANLDYLDEADFARKIRLATGVSALATALFANSPILAGEPTGYKSYRAHIWTRVDPDRCGLHRFIFETDAGFDDYVDWAVNVPMFFVKRKGPNGSHYVPIEGAGTYADLCAGRIDGLLVEPDDWALHMSTLFPEVRARPHLEVRACDVVPPWMLTACPALWKGLLYDEDAADAAWDLVRTLTFDERHSLAESANRDALHGRRPRGKGTVGDLAADLLAIAKEGLIRLADAGLGDMADVTYLAPLETIVAERRTLADRTLAGEDIHVPFA